MWNNDFEGNGFNVNDRTNFRSTNTLDSTTSADANHSVASSTASSRMTIVDKDSPSVSTSIHSNSVPGCQNKNGDSNGTGTGNGNGQYDYDYDYDYNCSSNSDFNENKRGRHDGNSTSHRQQQEQQQNHTEISVSSLSRRLNQMSVKEREKALYDLHGIPLDDEYFDQELGVQGNNIEKDPKKLEALLAELDRLVEERIYLHEHKKQQQQQQQQSTAVGTGTPAVQNPSGDGEEFGIGIKLARQQNPGYVHSQRIKFLRADRYDADLASMRMVRFFDVKRELFCAPGYTTATATTRSEGIGGGFGAKNHGTNTSCLGRDLRLSDFSPDDLDVWKRTGFFQLCGMRDRAKRAIMVFFGKIITEERIPTELVMRVYLYACNLWSRDVSTQKAGFVVIGYTPFNDAHLRGPVSPSDHDAKDALVDRYLTETAPLLAQVIKVGMCVQLRGVSRHFCYDHPKLHAQFEQLAGQLSTFSAARLRCHYANVETTNPTTGRCSDAHGDRDGKSPGQDNPGSSMQVVSPASLVYAGAGAGRSGSDGLINEYNPHKEWLYTLMTFGIPRDTIPIDFVTGEVNLQFHHTAMEAIEQREGHERSVEEAIYFEQFYARGNHPEATSSTSTHYSANNGTLDTNNGGLRSNGTRNTDETIAAAMEGVIACDLPYPSTISSASVPRNEWMTDPAQKSNAEADANFSLLETLMQAGDEGDASHASWSNESQHYHGNSNKNLHQQQQQQHQQHLHSFANQPLLRPPTESLRPDLSVSTAGVLGSSSSNGLQPSGNVRRRKYPSKKSGRSQSSHDPQNPKAIPSDPPATVQHASHSDIVMGRGPWNRTHPGNLRLKAMLEREREHYERANRFERMRLVDSMLDELCHRYGALFLYKESKKPGKTDDEEDTSRTKPRSGSNAASGPWLVAKREKAHDKITHDFRNLRRQKPSNSNPNSNSNSNSPKGRGNYGTSPPR